MTIDVESTWFVENVIADIQPARDKTKGNCEMADPRSVIAVPAPNEAEWTLESIPHPTGYGSNPLVRHTSGLTITSASIRSEDGETSEEYIFDAPPSLARTFHNGQLFVVYTEIDEGARVAPDAVLSVGLIEGKRLPDPDALLLSDEFSLIAQGVRALLRLSTNSRRDVERFTLRSLR